MRGDKHDLLVQETLRLHKAWWIVTAMVGTGDTNVIIPDYNRWENKKLKRQIEDLRYDVLETGKFVFLDKGRLLQKGSLAWLSDSFDRWAATSFRVLSLGNVMNVEATIGKLGFRREIDCPPYADVILQGLIGAAIRHPEYHLGVDLALLYNLFLEIESDIESAISRRETVSGEPSQTLGRAVILTCFNLLESFTSGLVTAYTMTTPDLAPETSKRLEDKGALQKRFKTFPGIVSGSGKVLDDSEDPIKTLFGECKLRRDSFVHCEPGTAPSSRGYVKEAHFTILLYRWFDEQLTRLRKLSALLGPKQVDAKGPLGSVLAETMANILTWRRPFPSSHATPNFEAVCRNRRQGRSP